MRRLGAAISFGLLCVLTSFSRAQSPGGGSALDVKARGVKTFYVDAAAGRNQISIFSESTLEDFTVVCNEVAGQWQFDPQNPEAIAGRFSIAVKDLRTGIDLRDQHVRSPEWLDANKYPDIAITISRGDNARKAAPNTVAMNLVGTVDLHGVKREIRIPCTVTYLDQSPETMQRIKGDLLRMRASLQIKLSDFNIYGPPGSGTIGLKVADELPIKVAVFGSTEKPAAPLKVDRPGVTTRAAGAATQPGPAAVRRSVLEPPTRPAAER